MADAAPARPSRGRSYVLLLISAMYLITYLDRVNISTAAPQISKEFGFDKVTMGFIFSAFVWAYALFQVPGGWLSDRFGARGLVQGVTHSASRLGAAIAPPIVVLLMTEFGWRSVFYICGAVGLLWSA